MRERGAREGTCVMHDGRGRRGGMGYVLGRGETRGVRLMHEGGEKEEIRK